jgi:tripartite-type tricarboxylate transporter receptor subunit TctC
MMDRRQWLAATASAAAVSQFPSVAQAQAGFPKGPIKLVVPFPPGATSDIIARLLAEKMGPALGQPMVVDNKPGASTIIASQQVIKSPPDGHTILLNLGLHIQNQLLYKNPPYDIFKDFANITGVVLSPVILFVKGDHPAKTVKEFAAWGKGKKLSYASWGNGSTGHLYGHMLHEELKLDGTHIPYKGGVAAVTDLIGGLVDSLFIDLGSTRQHVQSGRLRPLAVVLDKRMPQIPDVPTAVEAGINGLNAAGFYGLYAPAGTPLDIRTRLAKEAAAAMDAPDVKQKFNDLGFTSFASAPEQFDQVIRAEHAKWAKIVAASGVKLDL